LSASAPSVFYLSSLQTRQERKSHCQQHCSLVISVVNIATMTSDRNDRPATISDYDPRQDSAWIYSFGASMVPFCGFLYIHKLGLTSRVVEATVRSPIGVYGLFLLPFCTLAMEKSIYDTVQSWQGIDPRVRPADRGGFPSGGAGKFISSQ
jgi:hypothetical protein